MKITTDKIEHVANLARLNLTPQEKEKFTSEMDDIISYMDKLNELDTSNIKPKEHVIPIKNVFRQDKIYESFDREKILKNVPSQESGCFKVPKIVE